MHFTTFPVVQWDWKILCEMSDVFSQRANHHVFANNIQYLLESFR